MRNSDLAVLEMLGAIYEDLDIDKIEERFVEIVSEAFSFDRVALFFVKHKKEVLCGKLSRGFDPEEIKNVEIPIRGSSPFIEPLVTGMPCRNPLAADDHYIKRLDLKNYALIPVITRKKTPCWELMKCGASDCAAYGKKWMRCWLVSGTKCCGGTDPSVEAKSEQCKACPIFADFDLSSSEGIMLVDNSLHTKPISDHMMTFLSIISHSVGLAINNSKLYNRTLDISIRDPLTGLHNRRYFDERLLDECERAHRYGEKLSLIICDIDKFKAVNDTHGHQVGDSVLCWVSDILHNFVRKTDIVSRYGGEEFAILLVNTGIDQALEIAGKLKIVFNEQWFRLPDADVRVTLSFGVASLGGSPDWHEALVSRADKALYRAKDSGRNQVCSS